MKWTIYWVVEKQQLESMIDIWFVVMRELFLSVNIRPFPRAPLSGLFLISSFLSSCHEKTKKALNI